MRWRVAAALAFATWAVFVLLPHHWQFVRTIVLYVGADVLAVAAIAYGVGRYRPRRPAAWLLIGGGLASFTVADSIYGTQQLLGLNPFPSAADVFYLVAYPMFAVGLHIAGRARTPDSDKGAFIDAAIMTVAGALFAYLLIANTYVKDPSLALFPTVVASMYPLADLLLFAVALRFLISVDWRSPALVLLAAGIGLTLAGDVLYTVNELLTSSGDSTVADSALMAGVLCMGLAGMHPTMTELTSEPIQQPTPQYSVRRVVTLYLTSMVPVVVLAVQALGSDVQNAKATIVAIALIAGLVVARFMDLAAQTRRAQAREAVLSRFASDVLHADGLDELLALGRRTVVELVPDARPTVRAELPPPAPGVFLAPVEVQGEVVGAIVADERETARGGTQDALNSVARGLALGLEREALLAAQRADAANLAAQNARLVELDRMKDQLVSSVSHELRTPLTSMGGYAEMLLDGDAGELNEEQRHFAEVIDRNCRRLNRLIDDILFVARVDAGRLSLERGWIDIAEVAAASLETVRVRAEQGEVEAQLVVADDLPQVWADGMRMTQMFDNLLSNAVKFTPPGGSVTVTMAAADGRLHVEVADTGMGIPAGEVDRLFERFFRTSTVGAVAGTGLGLSIVESIVEAHDGAITVQSEEGRGTRFLIELPVRPQERAERLEAKEAP